jgi:hypothetical protein
VTRQMVEPGAAPGGPVKDSGELPAAAEAGKPAREAGAGLTVQAKPAAPAQPAAPPGAAERIDAPSPALETSQLPGAAELQAAAKVHPPRFAAQASAPDVLAAQASPPGEHSQVEPGSPSLPQPAAEIQRTGEIRPQPSTLQPKLEQHIPQPGSQLPAQVGEVLADLPLQPASRNIPDRQQPHKAAQPEEAAPSQPTAASGTEEPIQPLREEEPRPVNKPVQLQLEPAEPGPIEPERASLSNSKQIPAVQAVPLPELSKGSASVQEQQTPSRPSQTAPASVPESMQRESLPLPQPALPPDRGASPADLPFPLSSEAAGLPGKAAREDGSDQVQRADEKAQPGGLPAAPAEAAVSPAAPAVRPAQAAMPLARTPVENTAQPEMTLPGKTAGPPQQEQAVQIPNSPQPPVRAEAGKSPSPIETLLAPPPAELLLGADRDLSRRLESAPAQASPSTEQPDSTPGFHLPLTLQRLSLDEVDQLGEPLHSPAELHTPLEYRAPAQAPASQPSMLTEQADAPRSVPVESAPPAAESPVLRTAAVEPVQAGTPALLPTADPLESLLPQPDLGKPVQPLPGPTTQVQGSAEVASPTSALQQADLPVLDPALPVQAKRLPSEDLPRQADILEAPQLAVAGIQAETVLPAYSDPAPLQALPLVSPLAAHPTVQPKVQEAGQRVEATLLEPVRTAPMESEQAAEVSAVEQAHAPRPAGAGSPPEEVQAGSQQLDLQAATEKRVEKPGSALPLVERQAVQPEVGQFSAQAPTETQPGAERAPELAATPKTFKIQAQPNAAPQVEGLPDAKPARHEISGLEQRIAARAASMSRLPLSIPAAPQVIRRKPAADPKGAGQMDGEAALEVQAPHQAAHPAQAVLPLAVSPSAAAFSSAAQTAPAHSEGWISLSLPGAQIQRSPESPTGSPAVQRAGAAIGTLIQPAAEDQDEKASKGQVDLDDLARKIYPLIRHMIAVERERQTGYR